MQRSARAALVGALVFAAFAAALAPPASAATVEVHISNSVFNPATVNVHLNDTVTFFNDDGFDHDVTFETGTSSGGPMSLHSHTNWSRTFDTAGTFRFRCTVHSASFTSGMVGNVVVTDPNAPPPPPPAKSQPGFELPAALAAIGAVAFLAARRRAA